jgi:hypothetical protein
VLPSLFNPVPGGSAGWWLRIVGALVFIVVLLAALTAVPQRFRRNLILLVTFLGGLFYAVEFFWPTHPTPTPEDPKAVGNFLTPLVTPFGTFATVVSAWTVGLGAINLIQVHGKRIVRAASGWVNSLAFFVAMFAMCTVSILQQAHPNSINKNMQEVLFTGALQSLDSTMFSIIAFYIVSAAYRAFRVRSVEASLLLITAIIVMLGQTALTQKLTGSLPEQSQSFWGNFRVEIVRDWILTKANTPVTRAIAFGLGIGNLAVALRIWLGLERGSYFDSQP